MSECLSNMGSGGAELDHPRRAVGHAVFRGPLVSSPGALADRKDSKNAPTSGTGFIPRKSGYFGKTAWRRIALSSTSKLFWFMRSASDRAEWTERSGSLAGIVRAPEPLTHSHPHPMSRPVMLPPDP